MNPEHMSPEDQHRLTQSRTESDVDLINKGAKFDESGRLDVPASRIEMAHEQSETILEMIETFESSLFNSQLKSLQAHAMEIRNAYGSVSRVNEQMDRIRLGYFPILLKGEKNEDYEFQLSEVQRLQSESGYIENRNQLVTFNRFVADFLERYKLPNDLMESENPEEIINRISEYVDSQLYRLKKSLGKI